MFHASSIQPDVVLREYLTGKASVVGEEGESDIPVYGDWERPTNVAPDDFITVYMNGDCSGVGMEINYANGYIMVGLYCRLNDDGTIKKNRIKKILEQIDKLVNERVIDDYFFEYDPQRFITPTTPNQSSGYSVTVLNLKWHTTNNFNAQ